VASPSTRALVAHVLRRTTFGPYPGQVERWAARGVGRTITHVLEARPLPVASASGLAGKDDSSDEPVRWWLRRMANPAGGVHEKMAWFWHGHLTTSHDKVFRWRCEVPQHLLIRRYALGSFRTLVRRITVDPAMLLYLDGSWSSAEAPNENYSRELMELFCLGRGTDANPNYRQEDVTNGARALAGYGVDWETGTRGFYEWNALPAGTRVPYLGKRVHDAGDVCDAVLDHRACAPWVAGRIWRFLVGTEPSAARRAALARRFRQDDMRVKPLVEHILRSDFFLSHRMNRPRQPVEWVTAAMAALGMGDDDNAPYPNLRIDTLWRMGQLPFYPPSVAGWPWGLSWVGPGITLAKAAFAVEAPGIRAVADASDQVTAALHRCGLFEVSSQTRGALRRVTTSSRLDGRANRARRAQVLLALAIGSPEFALA
jgi:uncharacterized protein (DUF1800 family)